MYQRFFDRQTYYQVETMAEFRELLRDRTGVEMEPKEFLAFHNVEFDSIKGKKFRIESPVSFIGDNCQLTKLHIL